MTTPGSTIQRWGAHLKSVEAVPGLNDVHAVWLQDITARALQCSAQNSILAISGPPGVGKSFAMGRAAERCIADPRRPAAIVWLEITVGVAGKALLQDLYPQIIGDEVPPRRTARQLETEIRNALSERHRLLVLDEAHLVSRRAMRILRGLHDNPDTDFGLVLVGMPDLLRSLAPEMESRVDTRLTVEPLADNQVVDVLCSYHDVFTTADPALLISVNRLRARGEFRWWAQLLANLAALGDVERMTLSAEQLEIGATAQR